MPISELVTLYFAVLYSTLVNLGGKARNQCTTELRTVLYICVVLQVQRGTNKHDHRVLLPILPFAGVLMLRLTHKSCLLI